MNLLTIRRLLAVLLASVLVTFTGRADTGSVEVPAEAVAVLVFNFKALLGSKAVKDHNAIEQLRGMMPAEAKAKLAELGLDPFKDLSMLTLTVSGNPLAGGKVLAVLDGNFDSKKLSKAIEGEKQVKTLKVGGSTVYEMTNDQGQPVYTCIASPKQIFMSMDKDYVAQAAAGKVLGKPVKALAGIMAQQTGKEVIAFTMIPNDDVRNALAGNPQTKALASKLNGLTAGISLTDVLDIRLRTHWADAETAKNAKLMLEFGKPLLLGLVENNKQLPVPGALIADVIREIKVDADKTSAGMSLVVDEALINKLKDKQK